MAQIQSDVTRKLKWLAVLKAGLIAGVIFLVMPLGSPWEAMSFGSGAVMGRSPTVSGTGQSIGKIALHLALAIAYTAVIAAAVKKVRSWRAILLGGVVGLVLYGINFAVASAAFPRFTGMEGRVIFTHVVFGLIAAAIYKGMTVHPVEKRPA